ncbi:MAG TPA: Ig-like domain repeat protein, partial [Isosphaeraceae bacterium]|nr:Ig-like domain repeat protein [Isosphaeraceae bacterium]
QSVTFTATVSVNSPGAGTPTGTVTFKDGATVLGTGTLSGGVATFTRSTPLSAGAHHITAVYGGDTNDLDSTDTLTGGQVAITRVAGNKDGEAGFGGDGGPASQAQLNQPEGVATDASGNLYIADTDNNRIRKISPDGIISTVAGNGMPGYNDDGIKATDAKLNAPTGVAVDAQGNLFIADTGNNRIRKISPDGIISTVAGNGISGYNEPKGVSDGIKATDAMLNAPMGVAVDAQGNLFIADTGNDRIREVRTDGKIITIAGDAGFSGDGGPASQAELNHPEGVAVDASGNLYIADTGNNRIRKISPDGTIVTIAGNGTPAILNAPTGIAVGASGNLYIADTGNNRIRVVDPSGSITTLVSANGLQPAGIAVNPVGGLFISSTGDNQIFLTTETAMSQGGNALVVEAGVPNLPPSNNTQPAIQLVPAQNSSLALIATLVVTSLNGVESQIMSVGSGTASVLPTQATAPSGKGGEGAHAADESGNPQGGLSILIPPALRPWVLVLLGTNEALDRMRGAIPDLFTSGDGQQGPVELLSRAYQAVVRTIDEAIPFLASQGDPISLTALPVPAVAWDIDGVASDLASEEPFQPQATPSAASAAADGVRHPGEVLARPTKLWRVGLVGGFITGSTVIAANAVRKAFQRHRRRKNRSGAGELGAGASAMGLT